MSNDFELGLYPSTCRHPTDDGVMPARAHVGKVTDFLARHRRDCSRFHRMTESERIAFRADLVNRIADPRNLFAALRSILRKGKRAVGPDGECVHRVFVSRLRLLVHKLRQLSRWLLGNTYRTGPTRTAAIPKGAGSETRKILINNWLDRIAHMAIVQILEPIVDPGFSSETIGFRVGRSRNEALALFAEHVERGNRFVVLADIQQAFDNVPIGPLVAIIRKRVGHSAASLVRKVLRGRSRGKGIATGSPLSGFLLNVLLDEVLDSKLREGYPQVLRIRWADDIGCVCRTIEEAMEIRAAMVEFLRPYGFQFKGTAETDVLNLATSANTVWLGMRIRLESGRVCFQPAEKTVQRLENRIAKEVNAPDGVFRVQAILQAVPAQCGAVECGERMSEVFRQLVEAANEEGVSETIGAEEFVSAWKRAQIRYTALRNLIRDQEEAKRSGRGFAGGQIWQTICSVDCHLRPSHGGAGE